jgi:hypothetical protein
MKSFFIEKPVAFKKEFIKSGWALESFDIKGNYVLSFVDQSKKKKQFSNIHIVQEDFDFTFREFVITKRIFLFVISQELAKEFFVLDFSLIKDLIKFTVITGKKSNIVHIIINLSYIEMLLENQDPVLPMNFSSKSFMLQVMDKYKREMNSIKKEVLKIKND